MKETPVLALIGDQPALAAVLSEYAANAVPPLRFKAGEVKDADLAIFYAGDKAALEAQLKTLRDWKKTAQQKISLLVLASDLSEPEEELEALGLAGIFKLPLRLAALLDAGFSALRLAELKSPRKLSNQVSFDPFTRTLEDTERRISQTLTPKEADLLLALLAAGKKGLSREAALTRIWGYHREADSHAVETAAWRLRRKLEALFEGASVLESKEGAYYLRVEG